jgi:hypothetical protein
MSINGGLILWSDPRRLIIAIRLVHGEPGEVRIAAASLALAGRGRGVATQRSTRYPVTPTLSVEVNLTAKGPVYDQFATGIPTATGGQGLSNFSDPLVSSRRATAGAVSATRRPDAPRRSGITRTFNSGSAASAGDVPLSVPAQPVPAERPGLARTLARRPAARRLRRRRLLCRPPRLYRCHK